MDKIVGIANRLTDMDWGWQPFLYLRPARDERMTTRRVALMALHFGPLVAAVIGGLILWRHPALRASTLPLMAGAVAVSTLLFFPFYLLTFAQCWNIRAAELRGENPAPSRATFRTFGLVLGCAVFLATLFVPVAAGFVAGMRSGEAQHERENRALYAGGRAEGERWAEGRTQADCLAEGMRRDAPCHRASCKLSIHGFVEACLVRATPTPGLCDGVRPAADDAEDLRWREERCQATHPQAVQGCVNFIPLLQLHCTMHGPSRVGGAGTVADLR